MDDAWENTYTNLFTANLHNAASCVETNVYWWIVSVPSTNCGDQSTSQLTPRVLLSIALQGLNTTVPRDVPCAKRFKIDNSSWKRIGIQDF